MMTFRNLTFDLLEGAMQVVGLASDSDQRRRWLSLDGSYVMVEAVPWPEGEPSSAAVTDLVTARVLSSYVEGHSGEVHLMGSVPVTGASEARAGRLSFLADEGEMLEALVLIVAGKEGDLAVLHTAWPSAAAENGIRAALSLVASAVLHQD